MTQSKWSQKGKDKYPILTHMYGIERWYWWTYLQGSNGDTDIDKRLADSSGDGEGEMNRVSSINIYITWCKIRIASGNLLYDAESSNLLLCDNLEVWDGVGEGREVQKRGEIPISMADLCYMKLT